MSDPRFLQAGFDAQLAHVIEEIGEAIGPFGDLLAAAGKTQRWGRGSVDPTIPECRRETNEAWLLRALEAAKPELADVLLAIGRLQATMGVHSTATDRSGATSMIAPTGRFHELKTWPQYFTAVRSGMKRFEIRRNDRDFAVGDVLVLREFDPATGFYTDRVEECLITFLLAGGQFGVEVGFVAIGLSPWASQ